MINLLATGAPPPHPLDLNIWIPNDLAVIMQSWTNAENIGLEEKRPSANKMIFQRHLNFALSQTNALEKHFDL